MAVPPVANATDTAAPGLGEYVERVVGGQAAPGLSLGTILVVVLGLLALVGLFGAAYIVLVARRPGVPKPLTPGQELQLLAKAVKGAVDADAIGVILYPESNRVSLVPLTVHGNLYVSPGPGPPVTVFPVGEERFTILGKPAVFAVAYSDTALEVAERDLRSLGVTGLFLLHSDAPEEVKAALQRGDGASAVLSEIMDAMREERGEVTGTVRVFPRTWLGFRLELLPFYLSVLRTAHAKSTWITSAAKGSLQAVEMEIIKAQEEALKARAKAITATAAGVARLVLVLGAMAAFGLVLYTALLR